MKFDNSYSSRRGFDPLFLRPGKHDGRVLLPRLSAALTKSAIRLTSNRSKCVLDYHHYSVVMNRTRRFAIYSAANVDFNGRFKLARPADVWRVDPRIDAAAQVTEAFYRKNQFDRGHLTRREDLEYGANRTEALASAADTLHWTNCTPQHARFNESAQLWHGLEKHILEQAVDKENFRAQVITGPVFDSHDPVLEGFEDTPYPLRYWKVVAAIRNSGELFATAYVMDQRPTIDEFGITRAPAVPFTPFKTYQTTISEVERLTHLAFRGGRGARVLPLGEFDPLRARVDRSAALRSRSSRRPEIAPYIDLARLADVVT